MDTRQKDIETDIEKLELKGYRIIDIVAGDISPTKDLQYIVDKIVKEKRNDFYSGILYNLTSERFTEEEAKGLWQEILQHKYTVSEKLGRNIGIRVAALDYLENIKGIIEIPKIIEESEFKKTLALATIDSLTGLSNRRKFVEELMQRIANHGPDRPVFSVMMLDLDGFKKLNDTQGHRAGDLVLQEFALVLKEESPEGAVVGRYGGDEVVILLDNSGKEAARSAAEKIRKRVEQEFREIQITVSIGLVEFPADGRSYDELMAHADEVLYRAKEFGNNRVAYFTSIEMNYRNEQGVAEVCCVGDFNRWNKKYGIMKYVKESNTWTATLNLKPGRYRYKFLVNGTKWIPDLSAKEYDDDGFGGKCSIITVE